ncbi:MAG: hypothetical protein ACKOCM_12170 [Cyanobacteriota bacterium]
MVNLIGHGLASLISRGLVSLISHGLVSLVSHGFSDHGAVLSRARTLGRIVNVWQMSVCRAGDGRAIRPWTDKEPLR